MTHIIVNHKVKDYTAWKSVFDQFADFRKSSGEKSYRILQPANDPNNLTLYFEWDSEQNAETFMHSSKLKDAMKSGGVVEEPRIQYLNEAAHGSL